jgi:hypothetical protein
MAQECKPEPLLCYPPDLSRDHIIAIRDGRVHAPARESADDLRHAPQYGLADVSITLRTYDHVESDAFRAPLNEVADHLL